MVSEGERYRCGRSLKVLVVSIWGAPGSGGGAAVLPPGEEFIVLHDPAVGATAVHCAPVRYEGLHSHFVNAEDRRDERYGGYTLCIMLEDILGDCEALPVDLT